MVTNSEGPTIGDVSFEHPRRIFKQKLRPAIQTGKEARSLVRVVSEYKNSLNAAVEDPDLDKSSIEAAYIPAGKNSTRAPDTTKVFAGFNRSQRATVGMIRSNLSPDSREGAEGLIGENFSRWIRSRKTLVTNPTKQSLQQKELDRMAQYLIANSPSFTRLKTLGSETTLDSVTAALTTAGATESILREDPEIATFETHDWIATTAREARAGQKIYSTPYYENMLDNLHFLGRKKNGVGNVILYGPPGTGKTELLQEKNRREGYDTRVINIHYYTNFEGLIAGRSIQLGLDPSASLSQKMQTVVESFEGSSPDEIRSTFQNLQEQLQAEGKIDPNMTLEEFIGQFTSTTPNNDGDWAAIKEDFIKTAKARILRTSLPQNYQELFKDLVEGEILLAMQNGQRVVLDEIDKAGPTSLGGILSFLAKSPGETFSIGNSEVTIPSWFKIDATNNSTEQLTPWLQDRFAAKELTTPPAKDQLLIAAVRVADSEGNILLSPQEQVQLAGFFTYVVPEINDVLISYGEAPISNRRIQELGSYLVDFGNQERTALSFEESVTRLFKNRVWASNPDLTATLEGIVKKYKGIITAPPETFKTSPNAEVKPLTRRERRDSGLDTIEKSPLIKAINGLPNEIDAARTVKIQPITLTVDQMKDAQDVIAESSEQVFDSENAYALSVGFTVLTTNDKISINSVGDDVTKLIEVVKAAPGKIVGASADGNILLFAKPNTGITSINLIAGSDEAIIARGYDKPQVSPDGSKILAVNPTNRALLNHTGDTDWDLVETNVGKFEFSKSGEFILAERTDNQTSIISGGNLRVVGRLEGSGWKIIGGDLVVRQDNTGAITQNAYKVA